MGNFSVKSGGNRKEMIRIGAVFIVLMFLISSCLTYPATAQAELSTSNSCTIKIISITGAEGDKLAAHLYIPNIEMPVGGFPAVLFIHSWGVNQWEYDPQMRNLADQGYVTLCYDCRGWGLSEGKVATAGPLEMEDLNNVVDWLLQNSYTQVDPDKIGATGISYGGGQSLLGLQFEPRIKTVVAMSGWTDMYESLCPEDSLKWRWALALNMSGTVAARLDTQSWDWMNSFLTDKDVSKTKQDLAQRSALAYIDKINQRGAPPVFIVNGINDDLFNSRQMVRFYDKYQGPKKLILANGVHATAEGGGALNLPNFVWDKTIAWFDYWLKGIETEIMDEKPISVYQKSIDQQGYFANWPNDKLTLYLNKNDNNFTLSQTKNSQQGDKALYNQVLSPYSSGIIFLRPLLYSYFNKGPQAPPPAVMDMDKGSQYFDSAPLDHDVAVMGTPRAKVWVSPSKDQFQINFLVYDVDASGQATLVTHFPYTCKQAVPNQIQPVDLEMNVLSHVFAAGHKMRLVLSTSDITYVLPILDPYQVDVLYGGTSPSQIEMPLFSQMDSN